MKEGDGIAKRFYWLKLNKDFFKSSDIMLLECGKNGRDFQLFYLKLLLLGLEGDGTLRNADGKPYTLAQLAILTQTDQNVAKSALRRLKCLGLVSQNESDRSVFLPKLKMMVGSETPDALRKRLKKAESSNEALRKISGKFPQSKSIEKEIEKEIEVDVDVDSEDGDSGNPSSRISCMGGTLGRKVIYLSEEQEERLLDLMGLEVYNYYVAKLAAFIIEKNARVANHYQTLLKWYFQDQKV